MGETLAARRRERPAGFADFHVGGSAPDSPNGNGRPEAAVLKRVVRGRIELPT